MSVCAVCSVNVAAKWPRVLPAGERNLFAFKYLNEGMQKKHSFEMST